MHTILGVLEKTVVFAMHITVWEYVDVTRVSRILQLIRITEEYELFHGESCRDQGALARKPSTAKMFVKVAMIRFLVHRIPHSLMLALNIELLNR